MTTSIGMNGTAFNIIARLNGLGIPVRETPLHRAAPVRGYRGGDLPLDLPAGVGAPALDAGCPAADADRFQPVR